MEILGIRQIDEEGRAEAVVRFPESLPVFAGHFPGRPILPGVVLIDAAVMIAAQAVCRPLRLRRLAHVKFTHVVEPNQEVVFTFKISPDPAEANRINVAGRWNRAGAKIAEMQFTAQEGVGDGP